MSKPSSKDKGKEKETKKDKEIEEEESSSEEEAGVKVTRVGYIEVQREKKKWVAMYCVLVGGSFFYYKNAADSEPKGSVTLKEVKVVSPVADDKKKSTFSFVKGDETVFVGACSTDKELEQWLASAKTNSALEPTDPPTSSTKKNKAGVLDRMKKKTASATATSALGKKVMKAIVNEETTTLLNALKKIVKSESGSQKKADDLEKNIIKIAVKSFLLVENKKLQADDFLVADKPLREAFELMVKVFNGRKRVKPEKIEEALRKVEIGLKKAEEVITNLLAPHLTPKNMLKISQAFGCIADVDFLVRVFKNDALEEDLDKLIDAMEYYTQFHYH